MALRSWRSRRIAQALAPRHGAETPRDQLRGSHSPNQLAYFRANQWSTDHLPGPCIISSKSTLAHTPWVG